MTSSSKNSNKKTYNALAKGAYINTAPHLRHATTRALYARLIKAACDSTRCEDGGSPSVLDLGAGEGTATLPFLELGASVLAVDISERQLEQLKINCTGFPGQLEVRCTDLNTVIGEDRHFDIIVANSLLHHIPDYVDLIQRASVRLSENGVFFSFQDPMWRSTISRRDALLSWVVYTGWRLGQGDLLGGIWRRIRRIFGFYSENSHHDNTEYHAIRDGVNQSEICEVLIAKGFECQVFEYCSFHSDVWQPLGERIGVRNTFGLLATRKHPATLRNNY